MAKSKRVKIGEIGVDAGMMYCGDPCYIARTPLGLTGTDRAIEEGGGEQDKHWREFLKGIAGPEGYLESHATVEGRMVRADGTVAHTFPAGVVWVTGGDGCFPVFAEFDDDGTIARVTIDFTGR
jgi:hypothetical protein